MTDSRLVTGPHGEEGVEGLIGWSEAYAPKVHSVADGVHGLLGYGLASSTLIEGDTGCIVIDTGSTIDEAEAHQRYWRELTDKPVHTVIYTHSHYAKGTTAYLRDNPDLVVWGHEKVHTNWIQGRTPVFPTYTRRIGTQMGKFLPESGPDSVPNCGAGPTYDLNPERYGYVRPTNTVSTRTELVIDGVRVVLIPAVSDTDCTLTMWLPERGTVISNVMWGVFPNIGAIRGELFRNPTQWGRSVDDMIELNASAHIGTHGVPVIGKDAVRKAMTEYRDAIQFVYDQAIRGINNGKSPQDLVESVSLPSTLANSAVLQPRYGEFEFALRGVYSGLMGWYGHDTVSLKPTPQAEFGGRLVEAMGGTQRVLELSDKAMAAGEWQWAAELVNFVWVQDRENPETRGRKAAALRELGHRSESAITRNYYLTQARELEGVEDTVAYGLSALSVEKVLSSEPDVYIDYLRYQLAVPVSAEEGHEVVITFTDLDKTFVLEITNNVLHYRTRSEPVGPSDTGVGLEYAVWAKLLCGQAGVGSTLVSAGGQTAVHGDGQTLRNFFGSFDLFEG